MLFFRPSSSCVSRARRAGLLAAATVWLAACQAPPQGPGAPLPAEGAGVSQATTARAYREDAARHLYRHHAARIHTGKLPAMLYAVGVLDVEIDHTGQIKRLHWQRAPQHAPEVVRQIEALVRAAAPFPAPARMGRVTYTDVWLWDASGQFQLDTLTEGQL